MLKSWRRRSASSWAGLVAAAMLVAGGCTSAGTAGGTSATPSGAQATSGDVGACDLSNLPNWPKPGHVSTSGVVPVIASSERVVGPSRMVWTLIDSQNQPVAAPDTTFQVGFYDVCVDPNTPTQVITAEFAWGITGSRGFYIATPTFSHAGTWGAAVLSTDKTGTQSTSKVLFDVVDRGTTPAIGDRAPSVKTPTLADVGGDVSQISSDPHPDPDFYRISVDQALASKTPFVLAMATPAFCQSAECGPTLDHLKAVVAAHPITTINVEPYQLHYDASNHRLQPVLANGNFVPVEAVNLYGVPSEPWIFVIDGNGLIVGSFEAVFADDEMAAAIAKALGTS